MERKKGLIKWEPGSMSGFPVSRFNDLFNHMQAMFDGAWRDWDVNVGVFDALQPKTTFPKVNVSETVDNYVIDIAAAGFSRDDLALELKDNVLLIKGDKKEEQKDCKDCCEEAECTFLRREISDRSFRRVVKFPREIDVDKIDCSYKDGIVRCTIGKKAIEEVDGKIKIDIK
jgi:HSP20 family protein